MVLERSYFSAQALGGLAQEDLETDSLYRILAEKYGIHLAKSQESIEAGLADEALAEQLHIEKGAPLLLVTGVSYARDQRPVEFVQSYYRGDRYRFLVELARNTGGEGCTE
jgi:GntR family transcriptional regulator